MRTLLPIWSVACVVSVDERVEIRESVGAIDIALGSGDVRVEAGPLPIVLEGSFGGVGGDLAHRVEDGRLIIDHGCRLCAGEVELRAPADTAVNVTLGSGGLEVVGMHAALVADVGAGEVDVTDHGAGPVSVATGVGDVTLSFAEVPHAVEVVLSTGDAKITLPSGSYALDLRADGGAVEVSGVTDDPSGPPVVVEVAVGGITVSGEQAL